MESEKIGVKGAQGVAASKYLEYTVPSKLWTGFNSISDWKRGRRHLEHFFPTVILTFLPILDFYEEDPQHRSLAEPFQCVAKNCRLIIASRAHFQRNKKRSHLLHPGMYELLYVSG
jgi:hypothetical protein